MSSGEKQWVGSRMGQLAGAFTLIELLTVIAVIGILSSFLNSAISKSKSKAHGIVCGSNLRQLSIGWLMYAHDNNDRLIYNYGGDAQRRTMSTNLAYNWVRNLLSWELDSDNTNTVAIANSKISAYTQRSAGLHLCPSDRVLSSIQRQAGWSRRVRTYSMNAMVGHAGELMYGITNRNNPEYVQFLRMNDFKLPSQIFVFVDEHPDSINDGYFLNKPGEAEWVDLPASFHGGAGTLSFADGHVESHRWLHHTTLQKARPGAAPLPMALEEGQRTDFDWLIQRTSHAR